MKKGFTLVELLVVVFIIGVLYKIGTTSYLNYNFEAKIYATISSADKYKNETSFCLNTESITNCNSGSRRISKYKNDLNGIKDLNVKNGEITITLDENIMNYIQIYESVDVIWIPNIYKNNIKWRLHCPNEIIDLVDICDKLK